MDFVFIYLGIIFDFNKLIKMKKVTNSEKPKFNYKEIVDANTLIGNLSNTKNFPVESMIKLLDFILP